MEEDTKQVIEQRKESLKNFFVKNPNSIFYAILALIVWLSVYIRTRNLGGLKDITTGTWTLGPDLDPFLFLRWAQYIVENGRLFALDMMRNVPLGHDPSSEMKLLSYLIAWFYKFLSIFSSDVTITYAAVIFPVIAFALTVIAFFFLTRKIFYDSFKDKKIPNIIALIASFFLTVLPPLLPRTIAGIPEKESVGFLFIFLTFYFFISCFKSKNYKELAVYGILAGISTALLGLIWGGVTFVFITIGVSVFIYFILGQMNKKIFLGYTLWIVSFVPIAMTFSTRYSIMNLVVSTSSLPIFATWALIGFNLYVYPKIASVSLIKKIKEKYKIPKEVISLILVTILGIILISIFLGPYFIFNQITHVSEQLVHPLSTGRFALTVAENRQPYFDEWENSFGPVFSNIPLFFWLFIIGSIALFLNLIKKFKSRDKFILGSAYFVFLICLIFSRYSGSSVFNGESTSSLLIYFGGVILFAGSLIKVFYDYSKKEQGELFKLDFAQVLLFIFFFLTIVAARGGVRLVMLLVPPTSILVSYLIVNSVIFTFKQRDETWKVLMIIATAIILISALYSGFFFYKLSSNQANSFVPGGYQWQWQKAMGWVRDNTESNAVFGHWWDYGYWLQSLGERATVLDGGNAIVYWNHLMGRYVLTAPDDVEAMNFLYTHNTTHYLIDSTDIGKYSAYSSIGADENYDRRSYIPTFAMDEKSTRETPDSMIYTYNIYVGLDEDIIWETNNTKEYFAKENSAVLGAFVEIANDGEMRQPKLVLVKQGSAQFEIPIKYIYYNGTLHEFKNGLDIGLFLADHFKQDAQGASITKIGAGFYLSPRTVHSFLARKYLFGEKDNLKLVHTEPDYTLNLINQQVGYLGDFAFFNGQFLGPIKIWEIDYPSDVEYKEEYLSKIYPENIYWA